MADGPGTTARATMRGSRAELEMDGETTAIVGASEADARQQIVERVLERARRDAAPVVISIEDRVGSGRLLVRPDGGVEPVAEAPRSAPVTELRRIRAPQPATSFVRQPADEPQESGPAAAAAGADADADAADDVLPAGIDVFDVLDDDHHDEQQAEQIAAHTADESDLGSGLDDDLVDDVPAFVPTPAVDRAAARQQPSEPAASPDPAAVPAPVAAPRWAAGDTPSIVPHAPVSVEDGTPSFIEPEDDRRLATFGWRAALGRIGIRLGPGARERTVLADLDMVQRQWSGPRTIAVVNGKGGANKTPTTALLSAVFARNAGASVLAWDNNEARGTLGWRTEQGGHDATARDLLPAAERLLARAARSSDLGAFVHHQGADKYDVLRSAPLELSGEHRLDAEEFDLLHAVASKYYRLTVLDSGNDESAPRWRQMIDRADQLVIATTAMPEHAEAASLLLAALAARDARSASLAGNAVVIVSQSEAGGSTRAARRVAAAFDGVVRATVVVPFDRGMHSGRLRYDALRTPAQHAWIRAAAATASGL